MPLWLMAGIVKVFSVSVVILLLFYFGGKAHKFITPDYYHTINII